MKRAFLFATMLLAAPAWAEAPSRLVDLSQAPVSPSVLTDGKKEDVAVLLLRAAAREKVAASGFEALLERQKARDRALMQLLAPDSAVTKAFAQAFAQKVGPFLTDNIEQGHAEAIALQMVQSIFLNRRDDLASSQNLYGDTAWKDAMKARLGENPPLKVALPAEKKAELKNTALYIHTPGKPEGKIEPTVHVMLTGLGQLIGHAKLSEITEPGAPVHTLFLDSIVKALPGDAGAKEWLNEWLYLRAGRAKNVVTEFRPDSALMQDAVAQSESVRRSRLKEPPAITYQP